MSVSYTHLISSDPPCFLNGVKKQGQVDKIIKILPHSRNGQFRYTYRVYCNKGKHQNEKEQHGIQVADVCNPPVQPRDAGQRIKPVSYTHLT